MADNIKGIPFSSNEEGKNIPALAKVLVFRHATENLGVKLEIEDLYVVWFAFTLGNWKALISTSVADGRYYEVTHRSGSGEAFVDTYLKTHNNVIEFTHIKE